MNQLPESQSEERRFYLEEGLKVAVVVFTVLGITTRIEQPGVIAGFAAILAGLAEQPGSLRERTWDLSVFAILGLAPMVSVATLGSNPTALLALLFVMTAAFTWMSGYGERLAHVGWVLTIWATLVMGFRVWESAPVSYLGYACGSLMVVFAAIVPAILRGTERAASIDRQPLIPARDRPLGQLVPLALLKATGVAAAGQIGQQYFELNVFWVALTAVLMMPPEIRIHWNRSFQRAMGTVLGASAGYGFVWLLGDKPWALLAFEVAMAFMLVATIKRRPYGLFVFFLTVFVVTQLGSRGVDVAKVAGIERVQATLAGIAIAVATNVILTPFFRNQAAAAQLAKT